MEGGKKSNGGGRSRGMGGDNVSERMGIYRGLREEGG